MSRTTEFIKSVIIADHTFEVNQAVSSWWDRPAFDDIRGKFWIEADNSITNYLHNDGVIKFKATDGGWFDTLEDVDKALNLFAEKNKEQSFKNIKIETIGDVTFRVTQAVGEGWNLKLIDQDRRNKYYICVEESKQGEYGYLHSDGLIKGGAGERGGSSGWFNSMEEVEIALELYEIGLPYE